ncbi:MAG: 2-amino-4-hydroxy-6-hydroxymethyldihydropteridine diphosphokinase [Acidobacteria bacterium]|nr:2-amino-4-hydroxy-6-hydroxymethyldihydropteridine diphosphokinase [Acidobacteriota bacterium]
MRLAVSALGAVGTVVAHSAIWETAPIGPDQPDYLNAVVTLRTVLGPTPLLERCGMSVFRVERNESNGGSFRLYCGHQEMVGSRFRVERSVEEMLASESGLGLTTAAPFEAFVGRVNSIRDETKAFLEDAARHGKRTYVYGASTKGGTLLQYFGLGPELIVAAADRNPYKWGKRWAGLGIDVVSEEEARATEPDYFFVLPWHFKREFLERERAFLDHGGKFIFPLPSFDVVGSQR